MLLRATAFVLLVGVTIWYTCMYARRIMRDPDRSIMGVLEEEGDVKAMDTPFTLEA